MSKEEKQRQVYQGPAWAWSTIFETLEMDCESGAFDRDLRRAIYKAMQAVSPVEKGA